MAKMSYPGYPPGPPSGGGYPSSSSGYPPQGGPSGMPAPAGSAPYPPSGQVRLGLAKLYVKFTNLARPSTTQALQSSRTCIMHVHGLCNACVVVDQLQICDFDCCYYMYSKLHAQ